MDVTYTLTGDDRMWIVARDWLAARPSIVRRVIEGAIAVTVVPMGIAYLVPSLRHFIVALWLLDAILLVALVAVVVTLARQFFAPFLAALNDVQAANISIGPDVLVETVEDPIAIPWAYIRAVYQDPAMVYVVLDTGTRHAIPRRAFRSYSDSWRFGNRAVIYWRKPHPRPKAIKRSASRNLVRR